MNLRPQRDLVLGGEPRVQLLPATVKQQEKNRETRQLLMLLVALAVTVVVAGIAFSWFRTLAAEVQLEAAHQRTADLLTEQAEYAEALSVSDFIAASREAQRVATSNEIDWLSLEAEIETFLPAGATVDGVDFQAPAPWEPTLVPEGPLRSERIAVAKITVRSDSYQAAAQFVAGLPKLIGFSDVVITGSAFQNGKYETNVTITLDADARAERFVEDEEEAAEGDAASAEGHQ
jgi:hypothetical protein